MLGAGRLGSVGVGTGGSGYDGGAEIETSGDGEAEGEPDPGPADGDKLSTMGIGADVVRATVTRGAVGRVVAAVGGTTCRRGASPKPPAPPPLPEPSPPVPPGALTGAGTVGGTATAQPIRTEIGRPRTTSPRKMVRGDNRTP